MEIRNQEEEKSVETASAEKMPKRAGGAQRGKRTVTVIAVLLCVGAAVYLNWSYNKSAPLPQGPEVRAEVERFLRRLGYRLVLKELAHPPRAGAGEAIALSMKWQNIGSAPCYRDHCVAWRLEDKTMAKTFRAAGTPSPRWMPGSIDLFTSEFFKEPASEKAHHLLHTHYVKRELYK